MKIDPSLSIDRMSAIFVDARVYEATIRRQTELAPSIFWAKQTYNPTKKPKNTNGFALPRSKSQQAVCQPLFTLQCDLLRRSLSRASRDNDAQEQLRRPSPCSSSYTNSPAKLPAWVKLLQPEWNDCLEIRAIGNFTWSILTRFCISKRLRTGPEMWIGVISQPSMPGSSNLFRIMCAKG